MENMSLKGSTGIAKRESEKTRWEDYSRRLKKQHK